MKKLLIILHFVVFCLPIYSNNLKLTRPNGAEKFVVGTNEDITWEGISAQDTVSLEYSIDNGINWNLITNSATGLKFNWNNIPNNISKKCLVRVKSIAQINKDYVLTLNGHTLDVYAAVISPDGSKIISVSEDKSAIVWDANTGALIRTITGHLNPVSSIAISQYGNKIVTGSWDKTAKIWDVNTGNLLLTLIGHTKPIRSVAFSPNGNFVVTASEDNTAKIWDANTGVEIRTLVGHTNWIYGVTISPDGSKIITGSADNTAKIWDMYSGVEIRTLFGHTNFIRAVAISQDGNKIITGSVDKTAKIWDTYTGAEILTLAGHSNVVASVAISQDGNKIITGSWDKTAILWDANTGAKIRTLVGHTLSVNGVAINQNGSKIVTVSDDNSVMVWNFGMTIKGQEDTSDEVFSIVSPPPPTQVLKLTRPNGAEKFLVGTNEKITWEGISSQDTVSLEYSIDNGTNWNLITNSATGLKFTWTNIPKPVSDKCLVRIISKDSLYLEPNIEWEKTFGGTKDDMASTIVQTKDNGYFVSGGSQSIDGDLKNTINTNPKYWAIKLNPKGLIEWEKSFNKSINDMVFSHQQTKDNGFILCGRTDQNRGDIWIIKLNSVGDLEWEKTYGGSMEEFSFSILQTKDDGYLVAGRTSSINGNITTTNGKTDLWLLKLDPIGNIEWQKSYGGSETDDSKSIKQTSDGGFIMCGGTLSKDGDLLNNKGSGRGWVIKINSTGKIEWQHTYGGSGNDIARTIIETKDGSFIVVGSTTSNDGDIVKNYGGFDCWVFKISKFGKLLWQNTYGGSADDYFESIENSIDGGYILCGSTNSNDFDVNDYKNNCDVWIVIIDSVGKIIKSKTFGGNRYDTSNSIIKTNDNGYIFTGGTDSNDGDIKNRIGNTDVWVVKLSPDQKAPLRDTSDAVFSIVAPTQVLKLTRPNGAEKFVVGTNEDITWEGISAQDTVSLEYSIDNGANWKLITNSATGLKYTWTNIPKPVSDLCLLKVRTKDSISIAPNIEWEKTYGGSSDEWAYDAFETIDKGFTICGYTHSSDIDFANLIGIQNAALIHINSKGKIIWTKKFAGDVCESMKLTSDSGYILCGYIQNNVGISGYHSQTDFWVCKTDKDGNLKWQKALGGYNTDMPYKVIQTSDGSFVVIGTSDSKDGDININKGKKDAWVVKLDSNGNILWKKTIGGSGDDYAISIIESKDNYLYITGNTNSNDKDFQNYIGGYDCFVTKLTTDGTLIWNYNYGGTFDDFGTDIIEDKKNGILILGTSNSNDLIFSKNNGANDAFVIKIDNNGQILWENIFGGTSNDYSQSIDYDSENDYIISGSSSSKDIDLSLNKGGLDFWIFKITNSGKLLWSTTFGGSKFETTREVHKTSDNGYIIAGGSTSNDFDIKQNYGVGDWCIVKLFPEKKLLLQDTSDTIFSIVAPAPKGNDIDMKKCNVSKSKDSIIVDCLINNGNYKFTTDSVFISGVDAKAFQLINLFTPFDLDFAQTKNIEFRFIPNRVGLHSAKVNIITQSDTLIYNIVGEGISGKDTAKLTLKTIRMEANTGVRIKVPIILENAISLSTSSITSLQTDLIFNSSMLYSMDYKIDSIGLNLGKITLINMPVNKKSGDTLALVRFIPALGNAQDCDLVLANPIANGGDAEFTLVNGHFKLLDVCYDGGARFLNGTKQSSLFAIYPNPANDNIEIEYSNADSGLAEFKLINVLGEVVSSITLEKVQNGKAKMSLKDLPSGQYFGVFNTESINQNMIISVIK